MIHHIAKYTVNTSWRVFDVRKTPVHKYVKNNAKRTSQELLTWVKTTSVSSQDFMNFGPQTPKNMTVILPTLHKCCFFARLCKEVIQQNSTKPSQQTALSGNTSLIDTFSRLVSLRKVTVKVRDIIIVKATKVVVNSEVTVKVKFAVKSESHIETRSSCLCHAENSLPTSNCGS